MNNTMYVDYMTKSYHNMDKSNTTKSDGKTSVSFWDKVTEKMAENAKPSESIITERTPMEDGKNFSTKDMTLEEYKQYIYDKIAGLPIGSSQNYYSFSIHITDAGYEAMKNNPEYEKWVMDTLVQDFGYHDPWVNISKGRYVIHNFGECKEAYIRKRMSRGCNIVSRKTKKSYWKKREERRKKLRKQYEEVLAKRAMWKRVLESEKAQAIHENRMIARRENGIMEQTGYVRTELSQAYAAYEAYAVASAAVRKLL